jgi:hypothetical protein
LFGCSALQADSRLFVKIVTILKLTANERFAQKLGGYPADEPREIDEGSLL